MRKVVLTLCLLLTACGGRENDGEDSNETMRPGEDCMGCHVGRNEGGAFTAAGTVLTSATAGTDQGVAGVNVVIKDTGGRAVVTMTTNAAGNFYTKAALPAEFTIELNKSGTSSTREMTGGTRYNCNDCHNAGNRIAFP